MLAVLISGSFSTLYASKFAPYPFATGNKYDRGSSRLVKGDPYAAYKTPHKKKLPPKSPPNSRASVTSRSRSSSVDSIYIDSSRRSSLSSSSDTTAGTLLMPSDFVAKQRAKDLINGGVIIDERAFADLLQDGIRGRILMDKRTGLLPGAPTTL